MRFNLIILGLWWSTSVNGQLLDSIALFTKEPMRPTISLDSRGSFISNRNVRLFGIKVGLEHAGRVRYGIGYSFLRTPVEREVQIEENNVFRVVTTRLRLGYVTPYFGYTFYRRGPWDVSIPVQFGIGGGSVVYDDIEGRRQKLKRAFVFSYEPAMVVQFRFLKYFAVGAGLGYRLVITNVGLNERLTAPVYIVGLRVFFSDIYRDVQGQTE